MKIAGLLRKLEAQLIVSCQAWQGDAFRDPVSMARFAQAAVAGGAKAIRANSPQDVAAIRRAVEVPIIGIQKEMQTDGRLLITPSFEAARALQEAGADIVALDCTVRAQQTGAFARLKRMKSELGLLVMADIATIPEAEAAAAAGADAVLSTLRGYTDDTAGVTKFEPEFIRELVARSGVPAIAEGRISSPSEARSAIEAGAFAVIVGSAITRPKDLTHSFARAIASAYKQRTSVRHFIGVDLGGTNVKYGIVSSSGSLLWHDTHRTPSQQGRGALLDTLKLAVSKTANEAEKRKLPISSVGIATAGWVDSIDGSIAYATENLPGWTGTPVAEHIADFCHLPVYVENDANALAVAEKHFGAGKDLSDFVVITLGTGVGGGCYVHGRLNRGSHFFANAIGHIPLIPDGLPCNCGRRGCLETYANLAAFLRYAGGAYTSAKQVIRGANSGETAAIEAIETLAAYLARGCASVIGLLDPQAIILSGGISTDNPMLSHLLRQKLQPMVPSWDRRQLNITTSKLGYFGGVFGGAAIASESSHD